MTHLKVVADPNPATAISGVADASGASAAASCPWQATITAALADGAVRGVLIYEADNGHSGRRPINAGRATIRGLCIETLDDLDTRE